MSSEKPDLSRIDWMKCELPALDETHGNAPLVAALDTGHRNPVIKDYRTVLAAKTGCGKSGWQFIDTALLTLENVGTVIAATARVDSFIATELARLKLEDEYPMSADETREFLRTHPGEHHMAELWPNGDSDSLWFRFSDGVFSYTGNLDHKKWVPFGAIEDGHRYRLIESRNVPEPRPDWMPKTEAPEGCEWKRFAGRIVLEVLGTSNCCVIPNSKLEHDMMAACVAAYDERGANPEPDQDRDQWRDC